MSKCIMIQGTASSVGKSLITAGLCRVLMQDGHRVAPFKSQNMALNSYITSEGKEMGRAQVVQAEAAGILPTVDMNPILLKPTTDKKAQVIINGEVYKNMSAVEYHNFKPKLAEMVKETYNNLADKYDVVVIEGAGSPAEINLREKDIVNMGMAEIADAPVVLVGDINKGGVFASIAGTMLLLTDEEKARVKGVIINKFRGDIEILKPGLEMLEEIIKIPVLGVIPYENINIEDEDSITERFKQKSRIAQNEGSVSQTSIKEHQIEVVVIRLPHISNFTDFNALENVQGVNVSYVDSISQLGNPDLIILPGSKNTIEDLLIIRQNGLEEKIKQLNSEGTPLYGICGGYQMLGKEISDPFHTESGLTDIEGMCLLNIKTVFQKEKTTTQAEGVITEGFGILNGGAESTDEKEATARAEATAERDKLAGQRAEATAVTVTVTQERAKAKDETSKFSAKGQRVKGYEIHMGTTEYLKGCYPYLEIDTILGNETKRIDGVTNKEGTVFGTYLHGIFDNSAFTSAIINSLREKKGLEPIEGIAGEFEEYKKSQYDLLADLVRKNLDIKAIYDILGL